MKKRVPNFIGKRIEVFGKGLKKMLSGGKVKDFKSFLDGQDGIKGCVKASQKWFRKNPNVCRMVFFFNQDF